MSHVAELSSWVPFPYCSLPGHPFPIKSLALSARECLWTIHFWVLDKSLLSGPGRGPLSWNSFDPWLVEPTDADRLQIQRANCIPSSSWNAPRKNVQRPTVLQSRLKQGCQSSCLPKAGTQERQQKQAEHQRNNRGLRISGRQWGVVGTMETWEEHSPYQLPSSPCGNMGPTLPELSVRRYWKSGFLCEFPWFYLCFFSFFGCTHHIMWDLNSPTRDQTHTLHMKSCLNHWTAGEISEFAWF